MGKKEQRIKLLRNELKRQKSLRISDIEEMFQISESTARRMCSELETSGEAIRTFGGIQYMPEDFFPNLQAYSFDALSEQHVEEKKKIGMYASTLVCPGDTKTGFTSARIKDRVEEDEFYGNRIVHSIEKMEKDEQKGMPASAVSKVIFKIIKKKRSPACKTVGFSYKLIALLVKIVPTKFMLWIVKKLYG